MFEFNNTQNTEWFKGWRWCVSTATSFLSISWTEHFFATKKEADAFQQLAERAGYVTIKVTPDEY